MTAHSPSRRYRVNQAESTGCPCGTLTVRADTGLCEKCTAKTEESKRQWAEWREECSQREVRLSAPLPVDCCLKCQLPLAGQSQSVHDKRCLAKPFSCSCGLTYANRYDLKLHRGKYHHP
jgi:hypothetical protein